MDNRTIDIVSNGDVSQAVRLIWENAAGGKASHYKIIKFKEVDKYYGEPTTHHFTNLVECEDGTPTLILLWSDEKKQKNCRFPYQ